jgi:DUF1680 family protein
LAVHLYGASEADLTIGDRKVRVVQRTAYPWDGEIDIDLRVEDNSAFTVLLRIPGWCNDATLRLNGEAIDLADAIQNGYARIARKWQTGDRLSLDLAMPVERVYAHPHVRADRGRVALQRGPILFCAESVDHPDSVDALVVDRTVTFEAQFQPDLLGGVVVITGRAARDNTERWNGQLYRHTPPDRDPVVVTAIPYYAWDNREPGEMQVWLREA